MHKNTRFLGCLLLASPWLPQWAMFMITIAGANGMVVLGLMLFLRAAEIYQGTSEAQRLIIADALISDS